MMFEYWVAFGLLVSILMSLLDFPLRVTRLLYLSTLGMGGAVVGGVFAYVLYGTRIAGVDISFLLGVFSIAISLLLLRGQIEKILQFMKGGDRHAGWNI